MNEDILHSNRPRPIPWVSTIRAIFLMVALISIVAPFLTKPANDCIALNNAGIITTVEHHEAGCP